MESNKSRKKVVRCRAGPLFLNEDLKMSKRYPNTININIIQFRNVIAFYQG